MRRLSVQISPTRFESGSIFIANGLPGILVQILRKIIAELFVLHLFCAFSYSPALRYPIFNLAETIMPFASSRFAKSAA